MLFVYQKPAFYFLGNQTMEASAAETSAIETEEQQCSLEFRRILIFFFFYSKAVVYKYQADKVKILQRRDNTYSIDSCNNQNPCFKKLENAHTRMHKEEAYISVQQKGLHFSKSKQMEIHPPHIQVYLYYKKVNVFKINITSIAGLLVLLVLQNKNMAVYEREIGTKSNKSKTR